MRHPHTVASPLTHRGYTLLEILVVMAIMGTLLAMGVSTWVSLQRRMDAQGAVTALSTILMQASGAASGERSTSTVFITVDHDGPQGWVPARAQIRTTRVLGEWHMEDFTAQGTTGAYRQFGRVSGAKIFPREIGDGAGFSGGGKIGRCFQFKNSGDHLRIADSNRLNPRGGVIMEAWIYRDFDDESAAEARTIIQKGGLSDQKKLMYFLSIELGGKPSAGWGGLVRLNGDEIIPMHTWIHLKAEITPQYAFLFVDDVLVDSARPNGILTVSPGPLFISHPKLNFRGRIDEVRILGFQNTEVRTFGHNTHIVLDAAPDMIDDAENRPRAIPRYRIVFDDRGGLDRYQHSGAIQFVVTEVDTKTGFKDAFRLSLSGQISGRGSGKIPDIKEPRYLKDWSEKYENE